MLHTLRVFKARIFKALAHPTRVAIVEYLRFGELPELRLREKVGVTPESFAQHLDVLVRKNIVQSRVAGGQTIYSLRDQAFAKVLEALREYFLDHLNEAIAMLRREGEVIGDGPDTPTPPPASPPRPGPR
jgi:DNA-binding transcriptional ArsR family regulator